MTEAGTDPLLVPRWAARFVPSDRVVDGPVVEPDDEQLEVELLPEFQDVVGPLRVDEVPQVTAGQEQGHDYLGERNALAVPYLSQPKVLSLDGILTGLPEPLPQVGVDSTGTLQEFGPIELAVGARARILVEPADDALGELVGVVFD